MPTVDNLYALSELLQIPVDYLIVGNRTYQIPDYNYLFYARMRAYYKGIGQCMAAVISRLEASDHIELQVQ